MKIKLAYFKLSIPVDMQGIAEYLTTALPGYNYKLVGRKGAGIIVSKNGSGRVGAIVMKAFGVYKIRPRPTSAFWRFFHVMTYGSFVPLESFKLCAKIRELIESKYN